MVARPDGPADGRSSASAGVPSSPSSAAMAAFSLGLWMLCGYFMVIFNKFLISNWNFHFPFFLTTWHCLLSSLLTQILARTTSFLPALTQNKITWTTYWTVVIPISAFFGLGICLGNMAYQYLSVAYIQMIKAINPVPLLFLYFAFGREKPSLVLMLSVLTISTGVFVSSLGELRFSWLGFSVQIGAVLADCLRIINTDGLMKDVALDSLSLLYYTAPLATLFVGVAFVVFELPSFPWQVISGDLAWLLLANGLVAFSVNFSAVFVISRTSGMVMSVCGPFKDMLVIFSSSALFGAPIAPIQLCGFGISILGMLLYRSAKLYPEHISGLLDGLLTCPVESCRGRSRAPPDDAGDQELLLAKQSLA